MGLFASVFEISFFSMFQFLGWSNLVLHFYGIVRKWIRKLICLQMDWFLVFFLE